MENIPIPSKREIYEREIEFSSRPKHLLKILTYNVWDNPEYWHERIEHILKLIKESDPDVCCLLDVSEQCYNFISKQLEKYYIIFQVFIIEGDSSGIVLLCKRETVDLPVGTQPYYYDFTCGKGRVIGVELILLSNNETINILCTKLDDNKDNDHIRVEQFAVIQQVIKKLKNCIIAGDFNISSEGEQIVYKIKQAKLDDVWIKMGCPNRVKYTFDGKRNRITNDRSQQRSSRIYFYGKHLNIKALNLVGTTSISSTLKITPSCHYGLMATFQCEKLIVS